MKIVVEERKKRALDYFNSGYNCAQSVLMAFADLYALDSNTAAQISASFGGGMGRMRETCGAVTGMFMVMGLHYPSVDPNDKESRIINYDAVQRTADLFKSKFKTMNCRELLNLMNEKKSPVPSDRNSEYYAVRPCARFVVEAAEITAKEILKQEIVFD